MSLKSRALQALALSMILVLSACAGGGDDSDSTTEATDPNSASTSSVAANLEDRLKPFLGHWVSCEKNGNDSEKDEFTAVSAGGAKATITRSYTQHTNTGCTGIGIRVFDEQSVLTLTGQTLDLETNTAEIFAGVSQITNYDEDGLGRRMPRTGRDVPTSIAAVIGNLKQMLVETFPGEIRTYLKQP